MLPQTFTCKAVEEALNVRLNGPCMGDDKPFLLSASYSDGRPAMVKVLRVDVESPIKHSNKIAEYNMEREVLNILDFSGQQSGLVIAKFLEVEVPKEAAEVQQGTTKIPSEEGRPPSTVYAVLMPRYITSVGKSPKFELEHLKKQFRKMVDTLTYIHGCNIVHLDVKGDNIFVDSDGEWVLGDFGSCKKIGEEVISTTAQFHHKKLTGEIAAPGFDFYMLLVTLLIELLPDKHAYSDALCESQGRGVVRASLQKVTAAAARAKIEHPSLCELIEDIERDAS
ncbi:hypothetical protein B484DRAFT_403037 [Ochromonadaceae sp. CCMP2298]|nr:hypothetical protein B484DRAFT_403037 [Ochromonadaceae sp. CCMP2298]